MKSLHLLPVGASMLGSPETKELIGRVPVGLLDELAAALARTFGVSCHVDPDPLDASFAFDPARNQFYSTAILERMAGWARPPDAHILGITELDLYVPVLTFVFGEAQLNGRCALVSLHRLREEFYGLSASNDLLHERLHKEAVHELGHTLNLRHCEEWRCVMASTHAVERLDLKTAAFCPACRRQLAGQASS